MARNNKKVSVHVENGLITPRAAITLCFVVCLILLGALLNIGGQISGNSRNHTLFEKSIPPDVLKITAVRNFKSPSFPVDFEIEVKNVSNNAIYFIGAMTFVPDARSDSKPMGLFLSYGSPRLSLIQETAKPGDISIAPGKSYTLRLDSAKASAIRAAFSKEGIEPGAIKRLITRFQVISFGDGTGFIDGRKLPTEIMAKSNNGRSDRLAEYFSPLIKPGNLTTYGINQSHPLGTNRYVSSTSAVPTLLQSPCGFWQIEYLPNQCGYQNCNLPYAVSGPPGPRYKLCWSQGVCVDEYGNWYYCPQNYLLAENGGTCDGVDCYWW